MTIDYDTESNRALRATFANRGDGRERLLAVFEPTPVFFTVSITLDDGTPVRDWGGGKVALNEPPASIELAPGQAHEVRLELPEPLSTLPPGRYEIAVEYHNQYGEGCFTGVLPSRNRLVYEGSR
jgi:hypothetical protein